MTLVKKAINKLRMSFMNKEEQSREFYRINYAHIPQGVLFKQLEDYWNKYRFFNEIKILTGLNDKIIRNKNILDVGCGYTSVLNLFSFDPTTNVYGVDIVIDELMKYFTLNPRIEWYSIEAEDLSLFRAQEMDIVFCSNGIDHYTNPSKALFEIHRVLKEDGHFILTVDVFDDEKGYRNKQHPHSYTEGSITQILDVAGFEIIMKKYSQIKAQFCRYIVDGIKDNEDEREMIFVLKKRE